MGVIGRQRDKYAFLRVYLLICIGVSGDGWLQSKTDGACYYNWDRHKQDKLDTKPLT